METLYKLPSTGSRVGEIFIQYKKTQYGKTMVFGGGKTGVFVHLIKKVVISKNLVSQVQTYSLGKRLAS